MNISILLPLKESYSKGAAGAVSILVNSHLKHSRYKKSTKIYGSATKDPMNKNIFIPIKKARLFKNKSYVKSVASFIEIDSSSIIEIHNRPEYFFYLKKKFPYKKFILFFHNDPANLKYSHKPTQREFIAKNCDKIVFLSNWIKQKFLKDTNINDGPELHVFYPGIKTINKFPVKKNIVLFVGKLNSDKGYDIYLDAMKMFQKKFPTWKSFSIGAEDRRLIDISPNTREFGQMSNSKVLKFYEHASIAIANSTREEPLGRLPIEASSRGCISIVSNKGGLTETVDGNSIILKNNNQTEIFKKLSMLVSNIKNLRKRQLDIFNNFKYNLQTQTRTLDNIRSTFIKKIK